MRIGFLPFLALFFLASCEERKGFVFKAPLPDSTAPAKNEAVATFAEGCFWHTEIVFQSLASVRDAVSGYAGGRNPAPGYENVSTGLVTRDRTLARNTGRLHSTGTTTKRRSSLKP